MAGIQFTIQLDSLAATTAAARLGGALTDMTPLMDSIGRALVNSGVERITKTNIAPDGTPWEPSKRVLEHGGKTLHMSGLLMRSINAWAAPDYAVVGTNMIYAAVMQNGAAQGEFGAAIGRTKPTGKRPKSQDYFTPLPWGDIPARPYLGVSTEDELIIGDLTEAFLGEAVGGVQ